MAFSAIISSCTRDHGDMYDPEFVREYYESQWKKQFGEIDPNQTWNVAQGVQANLSIKEDALADYTFNIYTSNPLYDKDAKLMATTGVTTDAEGYAETSIKFDAPNGLKYFYVMRVEECGRRAVKAIQAAGGVLNASFGNVNPQGARVVVEGDLESTKMASPYSVQQVNDMIATGQKFSELDSKIALSDGAYVVTGTESLSSRVENVYNQNGTAKIVVANGGVLNLDYSENKVFSGIHIIVADGGTVNIVSSAYLFQNSVKVVVMQGGVIEDKTEYSSDVSKFTFQIEGATLYNAGKILNLKRLKSNNAATFYNAETGIYTGREILLQQNTDVITNWGKMDLDKLAGNNGTDQQGTLNVGCLIRSKESIRVQYLNINANTALECNDIWVDHVSLRENSILRAKYMLVGKRGSNYGTYIEMQSAPATIGWNTRASFTYKGLAGSSALISTVKMESPQYYYYNPSDPNNDQKIFVIDKPVFVEANEFADNAATSVNNAILKSGASLSRVGESNFAIFPAYSGTDLERMECTGKGNIPNTYVPPTPADGISWIIACEDLGSVGDYDFNDIVFSVTCMPAVNGQDTVYIQALAAGGTIPAYIYLGEELIGEIHDLFGIKDTGKMINTLSEDMESGVHATGKIVSRVVSNFSISDNMGGIRIKVVNGDGEQTAELKPSQGVAPQMICVESPWKWPLEYVSINLAYPMFGAWGSDYESYPNWYKENVLSQYVYTYVK